MPVEEFDPLTAPLEELKARANAGEGPTEEVKKAEETTPTEKYAVGEVVEDEQGNSHTVKTVDAQGQITETEPEPVDTIYQRRIDLGDGAGVQVFQGHSQEELIDKLVQAQEHATKKIRELNAQVPKPTHKERTADEEFVLANELMSHPTAAIKKWFQEEVGVPLSEFRSDVEAVKAFKQSRAADEAAIKFVEVTPEYNATPTNGKKIQSYLKNNRLDATLENLTKAYTELNTDGLLIPKPVAKTPEELAAEQQARPVIVKKKTGSGLSTRGAAAPIVKKPLTTIEDYERETAGMTTAQIRALANNQKPGTVDLYDF
jgi:hypothetical protein